MQYDYCNHSFKRYKKGVFTKPRDVTNLMKHALLLSAMQIYVLLTPMSRAAGCN